MAIRSTAKAVVLHDGQILVNQCVNSKGNIYYDLPGGGQDQFETLEDAVIREVLEETGYTITVGRFLALAEEICDSKELRASYYDYTHRLFHIFLAYLTDIPRQKTREMDWQQQCSIWVPVNAIDTLVFRPANLSGKISSLLSSKSAQYLGNTRFVSI